MSEIIFHFVYATLDMLEIHFQVVRSQQKDQLRLFSPVIHLLVVLMLSVQKGEEQQHVNVFRITLEIHTLSANQSALSMQNVLLPRPVSTNIVKTPVQVSVVTMQSVMSPIMFPTADVFLASLEMPSLPVRELQLQQFLQRSSIPAIPHHAGQMQFAMQEVELQHVSVLLDILVIPILLVDQSAPSILNVLPTKPVEIRNVLILVLGCVESMQTVKLLIILQHVNVILDTEEILLHLVKEKY